MARHWIVAAFVALCISFSSSQPSFAEKRGFVVGINGYTSLRQLTTASEDASAISKALGELGFRIETLKDPTRSEFDKKWAQFLTSLKPGDVAAFYFAGHGMQVDGANYLLPKDVPAFEAGEAAILDKSLNFHQLMEDLEARRLAATVYILDACRDNPFKAVTAKRKSNLGQSKGLARIESVYGAFVMYSAGPGEEAIDAIPGAGKQANSPYVQRLLPLLSSAKLSLLDVAKQVQVQVEQDARSISRLQRPFYFDGIIGQYYLAQLDESGKPLDPGERIPGDNVVRLGGFATWDANCRSRPAPRVSVLSEQKFGRMLTRFETFPIDGLHFGNACNKSTQRGIGVYYVVDNANANTSAIERIDFTVRHWSVAPVTTVNESFEIDLATHFSKRVAKR